MARLKPYHPEQGRLLPVIFDQQIQRQVIHSNTPVGDLLGLWTTIEFAENPCIEDCMKNIYKMRQIRLALGKDAHRVQRVVITEKPDHMTKLMAENPGTRLLLTTDKSAPLLKQFPGYSEGDISSIGQRIYIVDPLGNLMMRYPPNVDPSDVLQDLRQLLKATWIRPKT